MSLLTRTTVLRNDCKRAKNKREGYCLGICHWVRWLQWNEVTFSWLHCPPFWWSPSLPCTWVQLMSDWISAYFGWMQWCGRCLVRYATWCFSTFFGFTTPMNKWMSTQNTTQAYLKMKKAFHKIESALIPFLLCHSHLCYFSRLVLQKKPRSCEFDFYLKISQCIENKVFSYLLYTSYMLHNVVPHPPLSPWVYLILCSS